MKNHTIQVELKLLVTTDYLLCFILNTVQYNKEVVLRSTTQPDGAVRIVFATVALGMGDNLCHINMFVHYGATSSKTNIFKRAEGMAIQEMKLIYV